MVRNTQAPKTGSNCTSLAFPLRAVSRFMLQKRAYASSAVVVPTSRTVRARQRILGQNPLASS